MILVARGGHCTQLARMESNVLKGPATTNRLGQFDIFSWALKSPKKSPAGAPLRRFCACKMSQKFIEIHRITGPRSWKSMEIRKSPWSAQKTPKFTDIQRIFQTSNPPRFSESKLHAKHVPRLLEAWDAMLAADFTNGMCYTTKIYEVLPCYELQPKSHGVNYWMYILHFIYHILIYICIYRYICILCIWRFVKMYFPGFVDKSQFLACRFLLCL